MYFIGEDFCIFDYPLVFTNARPLQAQIGTYTLNLKLNVRNYYPCKIVRNFSHGHQNFAIIFQNFDQYEIMHSGFYIFAIRYKMPEMWNFEPT